jgi:hypothetical protein
MPMKHRIRYYRSTTTLQQGSTTLVASTKMNLPQQIWEEAGEAAPFPVSCCVLLFPEKFDNDFVAAARVYWFGTDRGAQNR